MITAMAAPANSTAQGLKFPRAAAMADGRPKIPLPRTLLTINATMLQRPIARISSGRDGPEGCWTVAVSGIQYRPHGRARVAREALCFFIVAHGRLAFSNRWRRLRNALFYGAGHPSTGEGIESS